MKMLRNGRAATLSLLALVLALWLPIGAHATPLRIDFGGEIDTVFDPEALITDGFGLGTCPQGGAAPPGGLIAMWPYASCTSVARLGLAGRPARWGTAESTELSDLLRVGFE